jgi:cysteinyl-tRNA synthetase
VKAVAAEGGKPTTGAPAAASASGVGADREGVRSAASRALTKAVTDFETAMDDDFNTAAALAAIHDMVREINTLIATDGVAANDREAILDAIATFDSVLGIFGPENDEILDADIDKLIEERQEARRNRDFARSDAIRNELAAKGIILEDTKDGVRWKRK